MPMLVRAFPLIRPMEDLHAFIEALNGKYRSEIGQFYRGYGISHESWHVQQTPSGPWVLSVCKVDDPDDAAPRYANTSAEFDTWFQAQVLHLSGVNARQAPLGPPTTCVFAWSDEQRAGSDLCA